MRKTIIALGLVAVMLLGITYVYAQGPGFGHGYGMMHGQEHRGYARLSSLTPEQKAQFQELRQKFIEETAQLRGALLTKRLELQSLWTNPKADPKAITDKEKELRDLQNQMRDKVVQNMLEARKFLTPEQIAEFGQGRGMGPGYGRGHMRGYGHGMGPGYGTCH
ncbi:MAG: Spy/CpxP family protein refolding chaperone [Thermodesulfobacteriota bacterium]